MGGPVNTKQVVANHMPVEEASEGILVPQSKTVKNKYRLFKPLDLWNFVMAAQADCFNMIHIISVIQNFTVTL